MHAYRLDPTLARLGKHLDKTLSETARRPLGARIEELLHKLAQVETTRAPEPAPR